MDATLARARQSSGLSREDVTIIAQVLINLAEKEGRVTPESFLEKAKPVNSPIHRFFDWNDATAAVEHRLHQARQIVRSIIFRPTRETEKPLETHRVTPHHYKTDRTIEASFQPCIPRKMISTSIEDAATMMATIFKVAVELERISKVCSDAPSLRQEQVEIEQLVKKLRDKALWAGKECPRCHRQGHVPGSNDCGQGKVASG